jgi:hypothetical protein
MLTMVSFYWYTDTLPRSMYPYRGIAASGNWDGLLSPVPTSKEKPFGYSVFPSEIIVVSESWAEQFYHNLVYYRRNEKVSSILAYLLTTQVIPNMLTPLERAFCGIGTARAFPRKR